MTDRLEELRAKMDSLGEIVFWYGTVEEGAELLQLLPVGPERTQLKDALLFMVYGRGDYGRGEHRGGDYMKWSVSSSQLSKDWPKKVPETS